MRLITYTRNGAAGIGAWFDRDRQVLDLKKAAMLAADQAVDELADMQSFIEAGPARWEWARRALANPASEAVFPTAACRLLAPLPRPAQIRDFLCFEEHLKDAFAMAIDLRSRIADDPDKKRAELKASGMFDIPQVWYERPIYYTCSRFAVCGPDTDVIWPSYSRMMDYELECAAIIGKAGRDIAKDKALDHIFGYTIFNDFSARDEQMIVMEGKLGPGKGKDFDNANAFGPCIVTADEIGDPYALVMTARVNGEEWSRGSTAAMYHKFEDIIAYVSRSETLHPGEVLCSGTVGTGSAAEQGKFLKSGDVVELQIDGIGILRNRVFSADAPRTT